MTLQQLEKCRMSRYEVCILVDQGMKQEDIMTVLNKCFDKIGCKEHKIEEVQHFSNQQLKYRICNLVHGTYFLVLLTIPTSAVKQLKKELQNSRSIARFIVLNLNNKRNAKMLAKHDYKDNEKLRKFLGESGRILSAGSNDVPKKEQKLISKAIKIARFMGLVEFVNRN